MKIPHFCPETKWGDKGTGKVAWMYFGLIRLTIRLIYDYCSRLYNLGPVFLLLQQYPYFGISGVSGR